MLSDPILNFDIALTSKMLEFGNIKVLSDLYNRKQVDVGADDLGLKSKL